MKTGATGSWSLGALSPLGENQAQQGELCGQHILCSAGQAWGVSLPPPGGQARWGAPEQQLLGASFSPASGPHPPPPLPLGPGRVGCGPLKTGPLGVGGPRRSPCFFWRRRDYAGSTRWPQHRLPPWAHPALRFCPESPRRWLWSLQPPQEGCATSRGVPGVRAPQAGGPITEAEPAQGGPCQRGLLPRPSAGPRHRLGRGPSHGGPRFALPRPGVPMLLPLCGGHPLWGLPAGPTSLWRLALASQSPSRAVLGPWLKQGVQWQSKSPSRVCLSGSGRICPLREQLRVRGWPGPRPGRPLLARASMSPTPSDSPVSDVNTFRPRKGTGNIILREAGGRGAVGSLH